MSALRKEQHVAERDWRTECINRPVLRAVPKPKPETFSLPKLVGLALMWAIAIAGVICMYNGVGYAF